MSRRRQATRRPIQSDAKFNSTLVSRLVNTVMIGGKKSYEMGASFFDGKGQPPQVNAVSHGCVPSRFRNINVINTGRKS